MNVYKSMTEGGSSSREGRTTEGVAHVRRCLCHVIVNDHRQPSSFFPHHGTNTSGKDEDNGNNDDDEIFMGDSTLRCPVCVMRMIQPYLLRHERALQDHADAKRECSQRLQQIHDAHRVAELQAESQRLRDRLATLRQACGDMAVRVATEAVENDAHREQQQTGSGGGGSGGNRDHLPDATARRHRQNLHRLEQILLEGSLTQAIDLTTHQVRVLRLQWARKVLRMHRLDIDLNDIKPTPLQQKRRQMELSPPTTATNPNSTPVTKPSTTNHHHRQSRSTAARGIAKIGGLPLPNAGPELYGVLPPRELVSALRLVATLTQTVARCLGIVLPHPILLTLHGSSSGGGAGEDGDVTDLVANDDLRRQQLGGKSMDASTNIHPSTYHGNSRNPSSSHFFSNPQPHTGDGSGGMGAISSMASSTSSLISLMDGSYWTTKAKKALAKATGQQSTEKVTSANAFIPPSTDATIVAQRLEHATAAILADSDDQDHNHGCGGPPPSTGGSTASSSSAAGGGASASRFALSTETMNQDDFTIALQLLQNNVIVLCIRAGVPVSKLWPAEAMLLNLYELDQFCQQQTAVTY